MELAKRLWQAFASRLGAFLEEAAFRIELAYDVLLGRVPRQVERRHWNRALEAPVLISLYDWTNNRLLFSVLTWPSLEAPPDEALRVHEERVEEVIAAISEGAKDRLWSMRWEVDDSLRWDAEREVWTATDGHAYAPPGEVRTGDAA